MNPFVCFQAVKAVIVSFKSTPDFLALLEEMKIPYILSKELTSLAPQVSDHPDLQVHPINDHTFFVCREAYSYYKKELGAYGIDVVSCDQNLERIYPKDCLLNVGRFGSFYIANPKAISKKLHRILAQKLIPINVKQGYCKCNMIILPQIIITSDKGIYHTLIKEHIPVALIPSGNIDLEGYSTGFIGGTCGMINHNELLFYGDLEAYKHEKILRQILDKCHIKVHYPRSNTFMDRGSIIPIHSLKYQGG